MTWKKWSEERPPENINTPRIERKTYRWRISPTTILGMVVQPEWTSPMHECGMGYGENEMWPDCSEWDGWNRTTHADLEWREALPGETETVWHGLNLLPCPFTGKSPTLTPSRRWIAAPIWMLNSMELTAGHFSFGRFTNLENMQRAWNTRTVNTK